MKFDDDPRTDKQLKNVFRQAGMFFLFYGFILLASLVTLFLIAYGILKLVLS